MIERRNKTLAVALVILFAGLTLLWAAPPDKVQLEKCGSKQPAVTFDHAKHLTLEANCTTCHHTQEDLTADSGEGEKCRNCHFEPEKAETPSCSEMSTSKNPYHKVCVGCHKTAVKADPEVPAPTKCTQCHPKG